MIRAEWMTSKSVKYRPCEICKERKTRVIAVTYSVEAEVLVICPQCLEELYRVCARALMEPFP